jgi:hypothetical protein
MGKVEFSAATKLTVLTTAACALERGDSNTVTLCTKPYSRQSTIGAMISDQRVTNGLVAISNPTKCVGKELGMVGTADPDHP